MSNLNLVGQKLARLVVESIAGQNKWRSVLYNCVCDCGEKCVVSSGHLKSGHTKSCGCFLRDRTVATNRARSTHGMTKTSEYRAYKNAKDRCVNPNSQSYENYGGRGIKFLFNSFEAFWKELGPKPSPRHSVNRINNDSHYMPKNVEWATVEEQLSNRRNTVKKAA